MSRKSSKQVRFTRIGSPVGELLLVGDVDNDGSERTRLEGLRGIYFAAAAHARSAIPSGATEDEAVFADVITQLRAYFDGTRTTFDVVLTPRGTAFQQDVWRALARIPYGTTSTYATIARSIGRPSAVRAVGAANARNPISIVVPCHRVVGQDGSLTGYAGGVPNKGLLLDLEARSCLDRSARSRRLERAPAKTLPRAPNRSV